MCSLLCSAEIDWSTTAEVIAAAATTAAVLAAFFLQYLAAWLQRRDALRRAVRALYAGAADAFASGAGAATTAKNHGFIPGKATYIHALAQGSLEVVRAVPLGDLADKDALEVVLLLRAFLVALSDRLTNVETMVAQGTNIPIDMFDDLILSVTQLHDEASNIHKRHIKGW